MEQQSTSVSALLEKFKKCTLALEENEINYYRVKERTEKILNRLTKRLTLKVLENKLAEYFLNPSSLKIKDYEVALVKNSTKINSVLILEECIGLKYKDYNNIKITILSECPMRKPRQTERAEAWYYKRNFIVTDFSVFWGEEDEEIPEGLKKETIFEKMSKEGIPEDLSIIKINNTEENYVHEQIFK